MSVDVEEIDYIIMVRLFLKLKTNFIYMTKVLVLLIKLVCDNIIKFIFDYHFQNITMIHE